MSTEPLDLCEVLMQMINEIPKSDIDGFAVVLRNELIDIYNDVRYTAPEARQTYWFAASTVLNRRLPQPEMLSEWQRKVASIWTCKEFK